MKSVLIIIPYQEIYPPMNGGMQRCFNVLNQLAKRFEVTTIIHQDKETFLNAVKEYPAINNVSVYSTKDGEPIKDIFSLLPGNIRDGFRYRWIKKQWKNSADGSFLRYYPVLRNLLKQYSFDTIILENLNTINAVSVIRKYDKKVRIIYDAHNVDSNLAKDDLHCRGLLNVESNLYRHVNAMFTCSEVDKNIFRSINKKDLDITVIPNGVTVGNYYNREVLKDEPEHIIFCGALWTEPNREGLLWFYDDVWSEIKIALPQLKLLVVGSGEMPGSFEPLISDSSVIFTGAVEDVKPWYKKAAVSIVPLLSGSGTRLKILEAMSYGLPVLSTSKGAEGIKYRSEEDLIIANEAKAFGTSLIDLLNDKQKRFLISKAGRTLVEKEYDWNVIGEKMAESIDRN